jgi:hypothetical protein
MKNDLIALIWESAFSQAFIGQEIVYSPLGDQVLEEELAALQPR